MSPKVRVKNLTLGMQEHIGSFFPRVNLLPVLLKIQSWKVYTEKTSIMDCSFQSDFMSVQISHLSKKFR